MVDEVFTRPARAGVSFPESQAELEARTALARTILATPGVLATEPERRELGRLVTDTTPAASMLPTGVSKTPTVTSMVTSVTPGTLAQPETGGAAAVGVAPPVIIKPPRPVVGNGVPPAPTAAVLGTAAAPRIVAEKPEKLIALGLGPDPLGGLLKAVGLDPEPTKKLLLKGLIALSAAAVLPSLLPIAGSFIGSIRTAFQRAVPR